MEVTPQHDSHYVPESSTLSGCGANNHGNNDTPLLLPQWKAYEKTYPNCHSVHNWAEVQGLGTGGTHQGWTLHSFWPINISNLCPMLGNPTSHYRSKASQMLVLPSALAATAWVRDISSTNHM